MKRVGARLSKRDEHIIMLVDHFELLTISHLALLGLRLPRTHSSVYRVLSRLTARKYLTARPRWVGGGWGGSSEYVFQLGTAGERLLGRQGRRKSLRAHQLEHTLEIADAYADLKVAHSVYDLLMSPADLLGMRAIIEQLPHLSFDILPGSENLGYAEPSLMMASQQQKLRERLAEVEDDYDFVLLDTSGHESFMHTLGHVYADEVILPTEADIANWETLQTTLRSVAKIREDGLNPQMRVRAIVVNRYQQGTNFGNAMVQKLIEQYRELLSPHLVMQTVRVKEAQGYGLPVVAYDPSCQPAQAYTKLAEYIAHGEAQV